MGLDIHRLGLGVDGYFNYEYLENMYGKKSGTIYGNWYLDNDSLILKIIYPIEYKIKKSFVSYSNFGSPDSIYFLFNNLYPEITKINQNIYSQVSISTLENNLKDTCPSYECFKSMVLPNSYCNDTTAIPGSFYHLGNLDTLSFFDPNDDFVDKSIAVKIDTYNCIKIFLARKPKFDFIDIPTKMIIKNHRLYFKDENGKMNYFKKTK